ncbi:Zinc finger, C3HC4 type (RING finger), putative [Trypanosoma equiperdum]|uniref:Zinc finger, C3HC4 type (RING finger), putative n=1 Tax=Trypanosoma equiperdum TaxID=5694 RepID=A0A1G4HZ95_TRYEQ|nr:Zinc finger, C3HC4 type (RING finger), putative [Trypanosoma equiperdum]
MAARALFELAQGTLSCPVCFDLMDRPMCFRCGHVYCANCADRCISGRPMCPLCNSSVQNIRQARPLPALAKLVSFVRSLGGAADVPQSQGDTTFAVASKGGGKATNNALLVPPTTDNAPVSSFPRVNGADPQATAPNSSLDPGETEPSTPSTPLTHLHENGMSLGSQMAGDPTVQPSIAGEGRSQPVSTTMPPLQQQAQRQTWPSAEEVLPPPQHQPQSYRVEVERCIIRVEGAGGYALVYQGTCALCGLDISDRQQVSKLLRHVLTMDPSCNEGQVRLVSQRTLGLRLGPLWKLRFGAFGQASPSLSNGSDVNTREGAACGGQQSDGGPSSELPAVLLHQTCLEWCMLRRRIIEGANALTLNVAATVLQSLHAGDSETICSFCRIKIGACLVPCARCGRRSYHYPCALLTGAGVCQLSDVFGILVCVECQGQH